MNRRSFISLAASGAALQFVRVASAGTPQGTVETHLLRYPWRGFWAGMFLVRGSSGCILIDTALDDAVSVTLEPALKKLGLTLDSIGLVVNTHSHSDHAGCNAKLKKLLPNAKFGMPPPCDERAYRVKADYVLKDGMTVSYGGADLRVVATPGHSPDSVSFLEPASGALFTGDALQGRGSLNLALALFTDPDSYRRTLLKLRGLAVKGEIRSLYLGHSEPPSRDGFVPQEEVLRFLDVSHKTVEDYIAETKKLLNTNPDAGVKQVRDRLIAVCGSCQNPSWPELSLITSRVMLNYVRKEK